MGDNSLNGDCLSRRAFVASGAMGAAAILLSDASAGEARQLVGDEKHRDALHAPAFELEDKTISDLQDGLQGGRWTSRYLTETYFNRIDELDNKGPALTHLMERNPDALDIADRLDAERRAGRGRGPLHGIPILIKDNIDTADRMHTSAGSLALAQSIAARDATVVAKLRAAGAVLLGKTGLSEWANFRSTHSSSGWNGRLGQGRNPYALDRSPSGSSSGSAGATAASYCAASIGTETDGSITSPSAACGLVGVKPTVGLVSRAGIIPIAHSQDTAGPMARSVRDAAIVLGALVGVDDRDGATKASATRGRAHADYTPFLDAAGLKGARIGVARQRYMGYSPGTDRLAEDAIAAMRDAGAVIVDPADVPRAGRYDDAEFQVLLYEFKTDLETYLASLGGAGIPRTLDDLIAFNERHADPELAVFGQEIFAMAARKGPLTTPAYLTARAACVRYARTEGLDAVIARHRLDAIVAPTQGPAWLIDLVSGDGGGGGSFTSPAAVAGYPHITVPMGLVHGLPVGLSFVGRAWSEPTLFRLAFAYEQATRMRRPPTFAPSAALRP